jgi:hypothetical protein
MAAARLSLSGTWAGIALGPNEYEFILRYKLARWQTLGSLMILPALWLVVAVVVCRLPHRVSAELTGDTGSLAEGDGFELLVPPRRNAPRARHVVSVQGSTSS